MGNLENSNTDDVVPISSDSVINADPSNVVLSFSTSNTGENGHLTVPMDTVLSGQALDFFPSNFTISQQSTGPSYAAALRYERDIVPVPQNGGFYVKGGVDASISVHNGSFSVETRPPIDAARANIKSYARDEIAGIRDDLMRAGVSDPDAIINDLGRASDASLDYVLQNPTEIRNFRASDVTIPDSVPDVARGAVNDALQAIEDRIQDPEIQSGLESIEEANVLYNEGMHYDYQAYGLNAGAYIEAGNAVKDVSVAGMNIDQVDYFATARVGYGATIYNMGEDGLYGCYGPEASVGVGVRAHFNERTSGVLSANHALASERSCPGGVTQSLEGGNSINLGLDIKLGEEGEKPTGTGEGRVLMSF